MSVIIVSAWKKAEFVCKERKMVNSTLITNYKLLSSIFHEDLSPQRSRHRLDIWNPPSLSSGCCRAEAGEHLFLLVGTKGAEPAFLSLKWKKMRSLEKVDLNWRMNCHQSCYTQEGKDTMCRIWIYLTYIRT